MSSIPYQEEKEQDLFAPPKQAELAAVGKDMFAPPSDHESNMAASIDKPLPGEGFGGYLKRTYIPSLVHAPIDAARALMRAPSEIPIIGPAIDKAAEGAYGYVMGDNAQKLAHEASQKEKAEYEAEHPAGALGSKIAGAALIPAPFAGTSGITGVVGRTGANTAIAAADAALRGEDALKGAEAGGITTAVAEGVLGSAGKAGKYLANAAESRALKAATGQNKKFYKDALASGKVALEDNGQLSSTAGRNLLEADEAGPAIVTPLTQTKDIAPKVAAKAQFYGEKIGDVAKQIDKVHAKSVSGEAIANDLEKFANSIPDTPTTAAVKNNLMAEAQAYRAKGFIGFAEAQEHKNIYKFNHNDDALTSEAQNYKKAAVGREMEAAADRIGESPAAKDNPALEHLIDQYKYYKDKYGNYIAVSKAANDRMAGDVSNRFAAPSDMATGLATTTGMLARGTNPVHAVAAGVGAGAVNNLGRKYGSSMAATGADTLSKLLAENPTALGKYREILSEAARKGNANLALTNYLLTKQDPEYQKTLDQAKQGVQP